MQHTRTINHHNNHINYYYVLDQGNSSCIEPPSNGWKGEKERLMNLKQGERRREYWCGKGYIPLDKIKTWHETYSANPDKYQVRRPEPGITDVPVKREQNAILSRKVSLFEGNITRLEVDAIVNATNQDIKQMGGLNLSIHNAAGKWLSMESEALRKYSPETARVCGGYKLPARYVISIANCGDTSGERLKSYYGNCLLKMIEYSLKSLAFPCFSNEFTDLQSEVACSIAINSTREFLTYHQEKIDRIIFCLPEERHTIMFKNKLQSILP